MRKIELELDTQYKDCKKVLEDRQGTQVRFLMLTMLPLLPADCIRLRELGYAIRSNGPLLVTQVLFISYRLES